MVRDVRKKEAKNYLAQAEEFLESAIQNLDANRYNVASFNAVQSMINSNDALTIHYLEKRASKDHREALKLHADVVKVINDGSQRTKLKDAIELRVNAGYMSSSLSKKDAEKLVRIAAGFHYWVKNKVQ